MDFRRLDGSSREALAIAQSLAVRRGHTRVDPEHLLLGLLRAAEGAAASPLRGAGANPEELAARLESALERIAPGYGRTTELASELEAVLSSAEQVADRQGSGPITPRHILTGILGIECEASQLLRERGVTTDVVFLTPPAPTGPRDAVDPRPFRDLSSETLTTPPILGRESVVERVIEILLGRAHHPILLGAPGVGKSAVAEGLARSLQSSDAPAALKGARVLAVRPSFFDDPERLVSACEADASTSRVLLYVDDPRLLAQALRASRSSRTLQKLAFLGAATPEDYYDSLSRQTYLEGRLVTVLVEPLPVSTTALVLRGLRPKLELDNGVRIDDGALEATADLAALYLTSKKLPGAAIELLSESVAARRERALAPPDELERAEAKVLALQSQRGRSAETDGQLAELRTAAGWLRVRWEQEREARGRLQLIRKQLTEREDEVLRRRLVEAETALPDEVSRLVRDDADAVGAPLGRMLVLGDLGRGAKARVTVGNGRLEISTGPASPPSSPGNPRYDPGSQHPGLATQFSL